MERHAIFPLLLLPLRFRRKGEKPWLLWLCRATAKVKPTGYSEEFILINGFSSWLQEMTPNYSEGNSSSQAV